MVKTTKYQHDKMFNETVNTPTLMELLDCGRASALQIGIAAGARIQIGKRVLWNLPKIRRYLDSISE